MVEEQQVFTVDWSKPLFFQVGQLGEAYQDWVQQPILSKESPRFFENDFLESLTKISWWVTPLLWLPVWGWSLWRSITLGCTIPQILLMSAIGLFVFSLIEYTLHRILHIKTKTYWGNTMHYILHGWHHKHPMDSVRHVFPPVATAIVLFPIYNLVKLFATPSTTPSLFGGGLLGYIIYDVAHYFLHHGQPTSRIAKNLKKYHLKHHFHILDKGFGITSPFWDDVFGTRPPAKVPATEKKSN